MTDPDRIGPRLVAAPRPQAAWAAATETAAGSRDAASAQAESAAAPAAKGPAPRRPSFDALYREHYPRVFGLCRRLLQHAAQAEDAAQEVFMRAYRALGDYDGTQPFAPWVLKIASNHCVDLVRRRAKEAQLFGREEAELAAIDSGEPGAVAGLIRAEREAELRTALDRLPDRYRIPLVLAYYNESSYDDIAAELGITRNHVGVLLLRGKQALRRAVAAPEEGEPQ